MRRKIVSSAAAIALTAMAHAQPANIKPAPTIIESVDLAYLGQLAESLGHSVQQSVNRMNEAVVVAQTPSGLRYAMVGMNCEAPDALNCSGLQLMMILAPMGGPDLEEVNVLNYNRAAVSVWRSPDKPDAERPLPPEYGVNRYIILDFGISAQNLDVNLNVFLQAAESVRAAIEQ